MLRLATCYCGLTFLLQHCGQRHVPRSDSKHQSHRHRHPACLHFLPTRPCHGPNQYPRLGPYSRHKPYERIPSLLRICYPGQSVTPSYKQPWFLQHWTHQPVIHPRQPSQSGGHVLRKPGRTDPRGGGSKEGDQPLQNLRRMGLQKRRIPAAAHRHLPQGPDGIVAHADVELPPHVLHRPRQHLSQRLRSQGLRSPPRQVAQEGESAHAHGGGVVDAGRAQEGGEGRSVSGAGFQEGGKAGAQGFHDAI
mmetsp:Transcript_19422/g.44242  ORF Transcript_19422/g.44242 Transcript_19422/m.44242 type:complete len:249 (-) Transcript_19422:774-1520(-)